MATLSRLACRIALSLPLLGLGAAGHAGALYPIGPRYGAVAFSIDNLGLIRSHGGFRRFDGTLFIDPARPERTRIAVTIAADSVDMAWPPGAALLSSPAYFDTGRYPDIVFRSTAVTPAGADRYTVQGRLEMRGVTRDLTLHATLMARHVDPILGAEVADIVMQGAVLRSEFGMTADRALISDRVGIDIHVRLQLARTEATAGNGPT